MLGKRTNVQWTIYVGGIALILGIISVGVVLWSRTVPAVDERGGEKNLDELIAEFPVDERPLENTLYMGYYEDRLALFVLNESGGAMRWSEGKGYTDQFDYTRLRGPRRIVSLNSAEEISSIRNFVFNETYSKLYVMLDYDNYSRQKAYMVDMLEPQAKVIWTHESGSEKYPKKGPALLQQVSDDRYIVIVLGICNKCSTFDPRGSVIVNIKDNQEEYVGEIGNIQIDAADNSFSYQKLQPSEESCDPYNEPNCDGVRTIYRPDGEVMTAALP